MSSSPNVHIVLLNDYYDCKIILILSQKFRRCFLFSFNLNNFVQQNPYLLFGPRFIDLMFSIGSNVFHILETLFVFPRKFETCLGASNILNVKPNGSIATVI